MEGVRVSNANGIVTVTWKDAKDDTAIAFYRVYYSHASILSNNGNYDDFERTRGTETAYSFTKVPVQGDQLFVGVLAVDTDGNESEGFETEASIALTKTMTSDQASSVPSAALEESTTKVGEAAKDQAPLTYTAVVPLSATGLLISFSKELDPEQKLEPSSFAVKDGSGKTLEVLKVEQGASNILLTLAEHEPKTLYTLSLLSPLRAKDGSAMSASAPGVQFMSYGVVASAPKPVPEPVREEVVPPTQKTYIANPLLASQVVQSPLAVRLVPVRQKNGKYTVLAQWRGGSNARSGYAISTSLDGVHFSEPEYVSATQTSMQFENIAPGAAFRVLVTEQGHSGRVESSNTTGLELPKSGIGFLGIAGVAGVLAARRMKRRRKMC